MAKQTRSNSDKQGRTSYKSNRYIVGIGASAGGLEAINSFFEQVPEEAGLSFVLIQHLSPDYKSMMPELLAKHTRLKIFKITNGVPVEPNCVYTIPADNNITISGGKIYLEDRAAPKTLNLPLNIFLKSLAEDMGPRAIGIILSGTGSDGTLGIESIKENGGMVIAQDPNTTAFDNMPKSAIGTGLVDFILHPSKMPETIMQYMKHPYVKHQSDEHELEKGDEINQILGILHQKTNLDFRLYKRATVVRRIERRMGIRNILSHELYLRYIKTDPEEIELLGNDILIGVTGFFRDTKAFEILDKDVLLSLVKDREKNKEIRIWVAGCSSGQEVYSIAILLKEHYRKQKKEIPTKIFATDIDQRAIEKASKGIYAETIQEEVPPQLLSKYFTKNEEKYLVKKELREMIIFARHDLSKDPPFNNIDLASCRNLLIYIEPRLQEKILSFIHFSLNENGYLFLGTSETPGPFSKVFEEVNKKYKIYQNKSLSRVIDVQRLFPFEKRQKNRGERGHAGDQLRQLSESKIISNFKDALLEDLVPPTVIINENQDVVHVAGEIERYIKLPKKQLTLNILKMIDEQLYVPLSNLITKVKSQHVLMTSPPLSIDGTDGKRTMIKIKAKPYTEPVGRLNFVILSFIEASREEWVFPEINETSLSKESTMHIRRLEEELKETKEYLQSTIEELMTANEELQATNEELMTANEELQSSNEELQSVNEELYTVNNEFQDKLGEMTELNDDLNNFIQSTSIATLFLDIELSIRRFTDAMTPLVKINKTDIGRFIGDFSHAFPHFDLIGAARKVLDRFEPVEREIATDKGHIYLMRILPYLTSKKEVKGVVFVFVDVNELKKVESQLKVKADELERSNADLEQFAFLAAHDLKAPITNTESLLDLMEKNQEFGEMGSTLFVKLKHSILQMKRTILVMNEVISIKKNLDLPPEEINFDHTLNNVLSVIEEQVVSSNAQIESDFNDAPLVFFPEMYLETIFQNLLVNAIKYRRPNKDPLIQLKSRLDNGRVVLSVQDNGRGIDLEAYGKKIFGLFQRFHLDVEGKGIGLHITKTMIEKYNGVIDVASKPNFGTVFTITFSQPNLHSES